MPTDPAILHIISNDFHKRVKTNWTTINDFVQHGHIWVESIQAQYNEPIYTGHARELLLDAMKYFGETSGMFIRKDPAYALIMKGGGIKGLAYIGALEEIQKFYQFTWYAGTSAGAITATLLSSGYTTKQLEDILSVKDFNDFKDAIIPKALLNLCTKSGLYEARTFFDWLTGLLSTKLDSTTDVRLIDLPNRLTIFASKKNSNALIFDSEYPESQNTSVAFAARCSMSIPFIFTPQKSEGLNVMDGGMRNNFPVDLILKNNPDADFLGLYLGDETFKYKKSNLVSDIFTIWLEANDTDVLRKYKEQIIVIDPSPISTLKFKLNKKEKEFLLEAGRLAALKFLGKKNLIDINSSVHDYTQRRSAHDEVRIGLNRKRIRKKYIRWGYFVVIVIALIFSRTIFHQITGLYSSLF